MAQERWRDVVGFEGLYVVSNLGNIMSLPRRVKFGNTERVSEGRLLSQCNDRDGYKIVVLTDGSRRKTGKVHRIVATAFIPNPAGLETVDHINANKSDNSVENLRWCSSIANTKMAWKMGLRGSASNEAIQALIKRTAKPVMRDDGERYESVTAAAKSLGVTDNAVQAVLHGRHKRCKGHTFKYVEEFDD